VLPAHAQRMGSLLAVDREFLPCRESKGGRVRWGARCGPGGGRAWGSGGVSGYARGRPDSRLGGHAGHARSARGTWPACCVHVRDLGGVKAQRLVERVRALPSRKEGMQHVDCRVEKEGHAMRGEVRAGGGGRACGEVAAEAARTGKA